MNDMSDIPQDLLTQSIAGRRLDNKCIILTGAAGSIGSYITRQLLREGARVMLTGRDQSKLDDFIGRSGRRRLRESLHGQRDR
jgi:malonyl-CoA reductase/3-hydroxypropionate dehydrogenase (NADP+)